MLYRAICSVYLRKRFTDPSLRFCPPNFFFLNFSLGTQTIQVLIEVLAVVAQICSLGEPDLVLKDRLLGDGLK